MPKELISPSFIDRLCAPSCMQCGNPMTMALSPGLMLATYHCSVCGLRDRAQIGGPALIRRTSEGARPYMQPTNLKAIAREAALRGDTKSAISRARPARAADANRRELEKRLRPQGARNEPSNDR